MGSLTMRAPRLRAAGLLLSGALALHGLRYLIAYGPNAGSELGSPGHSYLTELLPILTAVALALVAAAALAGASG